MFDFWFRFFRGRCAIRTALFLTVFFLTQSFCFANSRDDQVVSASVVIESKEDGGVRIAGRTFLITEATRISDLRGKSIPICDLPVPCEAVVAYIARNESAVECMKIEVTRLFSGSPVGPRSKDEG